MTFINEQLWGELERLNLTWNDFLLNTWSDFKNLSSTLEGIAEADIQGVNLERSGAYAAASIDMEIQGVGVEFSPSIIENEVEMIDSVSIAKKDYKNSMLKALPIYYYRSKVINNILDSISKELKRLEFNINDVEENLFIDTTISSIDRWEENFGITPDNSKPYDLRREKIKSKLKAAGTTTKEIIKNVASVFSGGEVEVIEDSASYKFIVKFTGTKGVPNNITDLTEIIEELKPAHLAFEYDYTYNTWDFLGAKAWDDISFLTWEGIQIFS